MGWFALPPLALPCSNPRDAGWGILPTLQWMGSWLPTYLPTSYLVFSSQVERRFHGGNRTVNHSIQ